MNFQYNSICRGGYSIMEMIKKAGVDPSQYIKFYNLRNYDRINTSAAMAKVEQKSGVSYEAARKEHDDFVGAGFDGSGHDGYGKKSSAKPGQPNSQDDRYQQAASSTRGSKATEYDSVASAYMLNGPSITSIPWTPGNTDEIDAFVSEELYIHTKCLIADDRVVIVGSANMNDRSQLGSHDSEIAVVIEDSTMVLSQMNGQPYQISRFAASLRRQLFRKHLGLLVSQDCTRPDANFTPITQDPNAYDWGSPEDLMVKDPLSPAFEDLWSTTAARNTAIFEKVFRPVPTNAVRTWADYQNYYGQYFVSPSPPRTKDPKPAPYQYGHVFKKNFPEGPQGVKAVKECLAGVRGSLVDMPLGFLCDVKDLVKEGLDYNALTEEIYT
jgi:phospholipase D1/2